MKTYARIDDGCIVELCSTDGDISEMFVASIVWVDITDVDPVPSIGWNATKRSDIWEFSAPITPKQNLAAQAYSALNAAREHVSNNYTILNEPTPDNWVVYLKALMVIANGTDTISTKLPDRPATIMS